MRTYTVEGIVIKRQNIGEADKLITLFTETLGKITLLARGIRKSSSRRVGSLELFNQVKVSAARGRGELDTLTEVQVLNSFSPWRRFLGRITLAYQLCEIVDKLTPDRQPHPEIFTLLSLSLSQILKGIGSPKLTAGNYKLFVNWVTGQKTKSMLVKWMNLSKK